MNQSHDRVIQPPARATTHASPSALIAMGSVLGCVLLVGLGAQAWVPVQWSDVPMTLQLLAVLLVGFALPPKRAVAAMTLYLGCGLTGLPVFVPGSGGLLGGTGGYLVGFLLCAWLISTMTDGRQASFLRLLAAGAAGTCVVFVLGITWRVLLVAIWGWFEGNVRLAIVTALAPFAVKAVIELLLAVTLVTCLRQRWGDLMRRLAA